MSKALALAALAAVHSKQLRGALPQRHARIWRGCSLSRYDDGDQRLKIETTSGAGMLALRSISDPSTRTGGFDFLKTESDAGSSAAFGSSDSS
jgi:hypothetical protein